MIRKLTIRKNDIQQENPCYCLRVLPDNRLLSGLGIG